MGRFGLLLKFFSEQYCDKTFTVYVSIHNKTLVPFLLIFQFIYAFIYAASVSAFFSVLNKRLYIIKNKYNNTVKVINHWKLESKSCLVL